MDRYFGLIYGVMVGDALGSRYEFTVSETVKKMIQNDLQRDGYLPMLGGGPFRLQPGQITDDSEMMISLLISLTEKNDYDQEDVAKNYIRWYHSSPPDIGGTIGNSLYNAKSARDMIVNSRGNYTSLSNGALMRIAPLGLLAIRMDDTSLHETVQKETILTHSNPIVTDFCYIYVLAIKYSLLGWNRRDIYDKLQKMAREDTTQKTLADAEERPEPIYTLQNGRVKYITTDSKMGGYIGVAFQNAFYEFLNGNDYTTSIMEIIKRGNDTDTNAAIAGGLLGAYYGFEAINQRHILTLQECRARRYDIYPRFHPKNTDCMIKKFKQKHLQP